VRFVPIAVITDLALISSAVCHAFAVQTEPGVQLIAQLERALMRELTLILLDNFEQLVDVAPLMVPGNSGRHKTGPTTRWVSVPGK
jgi:predicted ATPase